MNISAVNNSTSPLFNAVSSVKSAQAKKTGDEQDKEVKDSKVSSGGTILASATALRKDKTNFEHNKYSNRTKNRKRGSLRKRQPRKNYQN